MKRKLTLMPFVLLVAALVVLAAACGGAAAKVTVEKGLAAAAGQQVQSAATPEAASLALATGEEAVAPAAVPSSLGTRADMSARYALGGALPALAEGAAAGLTVQGYGRATAPADTARVQFAVSKADDVYPVPLPADIRGVAEGDVETESAPSVPPETSPTEVAPSPMTEADLQPLVDAIKAQGVSDADIEIVIFPADSYYSYYGSNSALVTVTLSDPSDRVGALVDAGTQAVNDSGTLYLQNVSVLYTVDDCSTLLGEARRAAVEDGRDNASGLAQALGVNVGEVVAAAEYAYSPLGLSTCDPAFDTYYPQPYGYEGIGYDPSMPAEVQIVVNVTLTFAIS
jgi:uncharacterized protein YggE